MGYASYASKRQHKKDAKHNEFKAMMTAFHNWRDILRAAGAAWPPAEGTDEYNAAREAFQAGWEARAHGKKPR